ncbi:MAG: aminotransferase class III-fold pyridoxal phosphate-dependent enzyme, partial [Lysobacterales bacterium]
VTAKGAVVYDCGGYGMLGFGHNPPAVLEALARPQVMANVMTPSLAHVRLGAALRREIGQKRGGCPYAKFLCLNSGSESVSLAGRFVDVNAKLMTEPGARHAGKKITRLAIAGGFHGRTELPARYSDSTRQNYIKHLASYARETPPLATIAPYDIEQLRTAFADADREGRFIEALFIEPVMGEGNPGLALTPEFYAEARRLTRAHGTLLLIDSIQAGLRAHGVLSIVDYPGFEGLDPPDMETYSKALNAGQFPLSVLAVTAATAGLYRKGVYGNTMSTNPRGADIACAVLAEITPELRANVRDRGAECVAKLNALASELPGLITGTQGTGLLFSCELAPEFKCYGAGSTEEYMRQRGFGVIHGGVNSLRFTPHFAVTGAEVDLIIEGVRDALRNGPRMQLLPTASEIEEAELVATES